MGNREFFYDKTASETLAALKTNEKLHEFISQRKTEINKSIDEVEQKMIMSLERSQPKPEILRQMLNEGHCFVCHNDLTFFSII